MSCCYLPDQGPVTSSNCAGQCALLPFTVAIRVDKSDSKDVGIFLGLLAMTCKHSSMMSKLLLHDP